MQVANKLRQTMLFIPGNNPKMIKNGICFTSILNDCFLMNKYVPTINAEKKNR